MRSNDGRAPHVAKQEERKNEAEKKLISMGKLLLIACRWMEKSKSKHEIVPNEVAQLIT